MENIFITVLYYVFVYITLFISVFWFVVFFSHRRQVMSIPPKPRRLPSISIIIPAYNEEKNILKSIKSLLSSDYPKDKLDIIVVDDASKDRTSEVVSEFAKDFKNIRLIRHKINKKKAGAMNTALKYIKSEVVGFLDADTIIEKDSLKNMVGYLKDKKIGGVIANIQPQMCKNALQKIQKAEYVFTSIMRKLMTFINALYMTPAFALYRTDLVRSLGGWDEGNITEDLEMGLRLQNAGYKIETCMKAKVLTKTPETIRSFWRQRIRWYRGFLHNSIKYKHIFFNRRFGDLGIFVLPLNYLVIGLSIFMFLYGISIILINGLNALLNFYSIGFDWTYIAAIFMRFNFQPIIWIFMAIMVVGLVVMMKVGRIYSKETLAKADYILYVALYPFIHLFLWLSVAYFEILGKKKVW